MTALCGGATSSARPGYESLLSLGPTALSALISDVPILWLLQLIGYVGILEYELDTFCDSDPPSLPTIDLGDVGALLNPSNPFAFLPARQKFQDLIGYYLWPVVCRCDDGTVPSLSAPPSNPGVSVNPPVGAAPSTTGCLDVTRTLARSNAAHTTNGTDNYYLWQDLFLSNPGPTGAGPIPTALLPVGATQLQGDLTVISNGPGSTSSLTFAYYSSAGSATGSNAAIVPTSGSHTFGPWTLPANTVAVAIYTQNTVLPSTIEMSLRLNVLCGSSAPSPVTPCCPPDPIVESLLASILSMVTLIQRQSVPFAYISTTSHAGLTGSGELTVQGLIGLRVTLTTIPSLVGSDAGDPLTYFQAGWLRWGDADGFSERRFIDASPLTWYPQPAGQYTRIAYSLNVGVVARIEELEREGS